MSKNLTWTALVFGCAALIMAGLLLLSGCARPEREAEYARVIEELNIKYDTQISIDMRGIDHVTPEQLREHLLGVLRSEGIAV